MNDSTTDSHGASGWFADEAFWASFYPVMFPAARMDAASDEVDAALALAGVEQGPILDLACGPGRHAIELARRGHAVTGVDLSAYLLNVARQRAGEAGVEVEFVRADSRAFVRPEAFRLALHLFSSFGYFDDRANDLRVLRNVHRSLQPGGTLVIDLVGKETLARRFQAADVHEHAGGLLLFERREILDDWNRVRTEWVLVDGADARRHVFTLNLYSACELKTALRQAGFGGVRAYGSLTGRPYDAGAERLVVVAVK